MTTASYNPAPDDGNVRAAGVTRLAPSPTGALHLGNARTFLLSWLLARSRGWSVLMRIEDIDSPRIKPDAARQAIDDLRWLGIDWDGQPLIQSSRHSLYHDAVRRLLESRAAYPCVCSRSEIESAASAPHASDGSAVYPGTCLGRFESMEAARQQTGRSPSVRFQLPRQTFTFRDGFHGPVEIDTSGLGDFPIMKSDGTPSYQLACALDDALTGVTEVVRGDDLLDSVPRQVALLRALGLGDRVPAYTHLPLVLGPDGRRLAKRHGDSRLSMYRDRDADPGPVLRLLARWSGITLTRSQVRSAQDLLAGFDPSAVPRRPIVATESELQVLGGS